MPALGDNRFAQDKLDFIKKIVQTVGPDILCLDEVSDNAVHDTMSAMNVAQNVLDNPATNTIYNNPVVSRNPGIHLNGVMYIRNNAPGIVRPDPDNDVGIPNRSWSTERTKRDLIRCRFILNSYMNVSIWFLHANATTANGKKSTNLACRGADRMYMMYMGDFNYPIQQVIKPQMAEPPNVGPYTGSFTQWKRNDHGKETVPGSNPPICFDPHDVIDYIIYDHQALRSVAVNTFNGLNNDDLRKMFIYFDHFPVAYDVTA